LKTLRDELSTWDTSELARGYYRRAYADSLLSEHGKAKADFRACIDEAELNSVIAVIA